MASAQVASGRARPPARQLPPAVDPPQRPRRLWPQVVATAFLVPWLAWLGAYFWLNSTPGRDLLVGALLGVAPEGRVHVAHVRWGPMPDEIELIDARVLDDDQRPILVADHLLADIAAFELLDGALVVERVRVDGFTLHLAWDAEGSLNLARAFQRTRAPDATAPARPPPTTRRVALARIELARGEVTLEWPRWGLQFQDVDVRGAVLLGPRDGQRGTEPVIHADLVGGHAHGMWSDGRQVVAVARVGITGFHWANGGFDVDRLELDAPDGGRVDVGGSLDVTPELRIDARGDVVATAALTALVDPELLPAGASVAELGLGYRAGGPVTARAGRVTAPEVNAGPIRATQVAFALDGLSFTPHASRPTGSLQLARASAARIVAPDGVAGTDVTIAAVDATIRNQSAVTFTGIRAGAFALPGGEVGAVDANAELSFGLTAGTFDGKLTSDQGVAAVSGTVRLNALTRRFTVALRVILEGARGAIAQTLLDLLPQPEADRLNPPVAGFALFETRIARESVEGERGKRWVARTQITEARLDGGQRVVFNGDTWSTTALGGDPPL